MSRTLVEEVNLKKLYKSYYSQRDKVVRFYDLPEMKYLISSGEGERNIYNMYDFQEVWTMGRFINRVKHYTIKNPGKKLSRLPVEMRWNGSLESLASFQAMMVMPDFIKYEHFEAAMKDLNQRLGKMDFVIKLTDLPKRRCAQLLHEGPYENIEKTRAHLNKGLTQEGCTPKGEVQEIYLNHPHCNPPEKLKILLRQEINE
ncbi:GyrI-like domain-containing protein [Evansella sp. LMS18]|uniref:GyrI-like domain-containing protein n=1 Tax=Evansella sp. LMS18 TaxID=2924033 RepID=UPI0020D1985D|nr:GyrI-like domain-containing protein [Evansella sp. LMS18]UTR10754.1 GyrI-like domain-containing protein [Evansella sp. LMS18]